MVMVTFKITRVVTRYEEATLECEVPDYVSDSDMIENLLKTFAESVQLTVPWMLVEERVTSFGDVEVVAGLDHLRNKNVIGDVFLSRRGDRLRINSLFLRTDDPDPDDLLVGNPFLLGAELRQPDNTEAAEAEAKREAELGMSDDISDPSFSQGEKKL
jgi:hypothetical protein